MCKLLIVFTVWAGAMLVALPCRAQPADASVPIPASAFYKPADLADVKLSPSGELLAVRTGSPNGRAGLYVINLREPGKSATVARFADADVAAFHWVGNGRLVFNLIDTQRGLGDQLNAPGLFTASADGRELRMLVKLDNPAVSAMRTVGREPLPYNHMLLHVPSNQLEGEEQVIVGEYRFDRRSSVREIIAKRLNILSGQVRSLAIGLPERVYGWHFDAEGEPRIVRAQQEGRTLIYHRPRGSAEWQRIADFDSLRADWSVHGVDGDTLYVRRASGPNGELALFRFDLRERKLEPAPLVSAPGYDVSGALLRERDGAEVLGVRVITDAPSTVWLHPGLKAIQQTVDAKLPGRINELSCRRCLSDDAVVLVRSFADTDPGQWLVFRPAKNEWNPVGAVRRDIDPRRMATLDLHRIKARDGLEIPVWLTVPRGVKASPGDAAKAPPAVVMVHGGPFARGTVWGWQAQEQFLASRGYVVIAPEFRGSTGYGQRLARAGWKQWGHGMQDDIADAVAWAVQQGFADPKRVCIAGGSFGGYSALISSVRYPDLYRCAAAWVAVTDPALLYADIWISDISEDAKRHYFPQVLGHPSHDAELLKSISPLQHAEKLTKPLLLVMGRKDRRVPIDHGDKLNQAMQAAGLKPQYVVYDGEGHGWLMQETRRDFYDRLERFFGEHLR